MKDLVAVCTEAGCAEVQTYVQSGNIVFRAGRAEASRLPAVIEEAIADRFGLAVPVIVRRRSSRGTTCVA
jgi:uncharacterized protein (DUF1697 family)